MRPLLLLVLAIVAGAILLLWKRPPERAPRPPGLEEPAAEPPAEPKPHEVECEVAGVAARTLRVHVAVISEFTPEEQEMLADPDYVTLTGPQRPLESPNGEVLTDDDFATLTGPPFRLPISRNVSHAFVLVLADGCNPFVWEYVRDEPVKITLGPATRVTVEVRDDDDTPISNATVFGAARYDLRPHVAARTSAVGKATLVLNQHGTLFARAPGYAWGQAGFQKPHITLEQGYIVAGLVVDSAGRPLAGATVRLKEGGGNVVRSIIRPVRRTGADGAFRFEHISAGECEIVAKAEGFMYAYGGDIWSGDESVRIVMHRPTSVSGRVVDENDKPVRDSWVSLRIDEDAHLGEGGECDDLGRFAIESVRPGRFTLILNGNEGELPIEVVEGQDVTGLVVRMRRPKEERSTVRLRILRPGGIPRAHATVEALDIHKAETDGQGRVSLPMPVVGGTRVLVRIRGDPPHEVYAITDAPEAEIRLPLPVDTVIEVEGSPPGARVSLSRVYWSQWPAEIDGVFVFRANPRLTYDLWANADGHVAKTIKWRAPSDGKPTVIALNKRASLTVRVVDEQGKPVEDARVVAWGPPWIMLAQPEQMSVGGEVVLRALRPGFVTVVAGRRHVPEVVARIELKSGENKVLEAPLVLRGYRIYEGRVGDEHGRPVGGAAVVVEDRVGFQSGWTTATRADGRFRIRLPKEGDLRLFVRKENFGAVLVDTSVPCDIRLPAGGRLKLTVASGPDRKLNYERETAVANRPGRIEWLWRQVVVRESIPRFVVDHAAAGTLRMRIDGREHTFPIRPGETTRAPLPR